MVIAHMNVLEASSATAHRRDPGHHFTSLCITMALYLTNNLNFTIKFKPVLLFLDV